MSIQAIVDVLDHSQQKKNDRLALISIANYADDLRSCWPSVQRIANEGKMSYRTAIRVVKALNGTNELAVIWNGGRLHIRNSKDRTNLYLLLVGLDWADVLTRKVYALQQNRVIRRYGEFQYPDNLSGLPDVDPAENPGKLPGFSEQSLEDTKAAILEVLRVYGWLSEEGKPSITKQIETYPPLDYFDFTRDMLLEDIRFNLTHLPEDAPIEDIQLCLPGDGLPLFSGPRDPDKTKGYPAILRQDPDIAMSGNPLTESPYLNQVTVMNIIHQVKSLNY